MATKKSTASKVITTIVNVIIWLFVIFATVITVLTFAATSSKEKVPTIGSKAILTVQSDSMSPTFKKGDIIIAKKVTEEEAEKLEAEKDIITFEADLDGNGTYELNSHRIKEVNKTERGTVISYVTKGDNNSMADNYIVATDKVLFKYTGTRIKGAGKVLDTLQSKKGFLLYIVLPMILFFIYELIIFVKKYTELKAGKNAEITAEDEERIKQQAIEEYLKAKEDVKPAEEVAEAPAEEAAEAVAEEAPAEEAAEEVAEEPAEDPAE